MIMECKQTEVSSRIREVAHRSVIASLRLAFNLNLSCQPVARMVCQVLTSSASRRPVGRVELRSPSSFDRVLEPAPDIDRLWGQP